MAGQSETAELILKMRTDAFKRDMSSMKGMLKNFGMQALKVGAIMTAISLPVTAFAKKGIENQARFDDAMTQSLAIMSNVSDSMRKQMEDQATMLSTKLPLAANQAAQSYFYLASAGLNAEQSLAALPVVARFATAGMFDMATATDLLTDAQSALGLYSKNTAENIKNMTMLSDLFVKGNTLANTSVQQLSEAITNEAGAAIRNFNIDLKDGIATLAAYADQGIKGNVAGSMFGRSIRLLAAAAIKHKEAFKRMNIEILNSQGEFNSFAKIAGQMEVALGKLSTAERVAALEQLGFKARVQQAILPLIGASKNIERYRKELEKAGGTTKRVAEEQIKALGVQLKILNNMLDNLSRSIIASVDKPIMKVVKWLQRLFLYLTDLPKHVRQIIAAVGAVLIVAGPLIVLLGTLSLSIVGIVAVLPLLKVGLLWLAPVLLKLIAVTGVLIVSWKALKAVWNGLAAGLKSSGIFDEMIKGFITTRKEIKNMKAEAEGSKTFWRTLKVEIEKTTRYATLAFEIFGHNIGTVIFTAGKNIGSFIQFFKDIWHKGLKAAWQLIKAFGRDVGNMFSGLAKEMWNAIRLKKTDFTRVFANLGKEFEREAARLKIELPTIVKPDYKGLDDYKKQFADIAKWYKKAMKDALNAPDILKQGKGIISRLMDFLKSGLDQALKYFQSVSAKKLPQLPVTPSTTAKTYTEATFADTVEAQKRQFGMATDNKQVEKNTAIIAAESKKTAQATNEMKNKISQPMIYKMA